MRIPRDRILPIIVFGQFAGVSMWFAGNAVIGGIQQEYGLPADALGHIISAVQLGFIAGTLVFAMLTIADRFSPSRVFFASAVAGAIANSAVLLLGGQFGLLLVLRFLTGFCLAGIYPVGMKIAADHYPEGLGKALGYILAALVLGTAFPHFVKAFTEGLSWRYVLITTSCASVLGGLMVSLVPDGPGRHAARQLDVSAFFRVFRNDSFRSAAFGYFGHMWELYAFWTFVPLALAFYSGVHDVDMSVSIAAFTIIAAGAISCILGGYISIRHGSGRVAFISLLISGICCCLSPLFYALPEWIFLGAMSIWGMSVISDSPQFSTLVARTAASEVRGTALTIVNCVGFAITIVSIQLLNLLSTNIGLEYLFLPLALGPVAGLISMRRIIRL